MKKLAGLILMMVCVSGIYSQVTVHFCASVESANGYCNFDNTKFIAARDSSSGRVFMEVRGAGAPIGATNVVFKVYKLNATGEEKFQNMLQQAIQPNWAFAWMPYVFDSPGKYVVKVYNESDQLICSNGFEFLPFPKDK